MFIYYWPVSNKIRTKYIGGIKMEIKTGIIGIGNAGGQVAALAKENGFDALASNIS